MKHTVVTSMSREIYEGHGKDFLRTFTQHWPASVRLVLFADKDLLDLWSEQESEAAYESMRLLDKAEPDADPRDYEVSPAPIPGPVGMQIRAVAEVAHHDEWMARIAPFPLMRGDLGNGQYSIQFDARMARKSFIQAHACEQFGGKVFWVDADVVTHAPVTVEFLDKCLPDDKLCCYLGRDWFYTESGFLGFNADHPGCETFMAAYRNVFLSGAIFTQKQWHDCIGFDVLRSGLPRKFFNDLAAGLPEGAMHVFINSPLGAYLDHRKGGRKKTRSTKEDLVIERSEPYWQFNA